MLDEMICVINNVSPFYTDRRNNLLSTNEETLVTNYHLIKENKPDLVPRELKGWIALIIWLGIFITFADALYEDQVGKFDWKRSFIGNVKLALKNNVGNKKYFVATEENVIASLDTSNGEILWRRVLEENDRGEIQYIHFYKELFTICGKNIVTVTGWDIQDGYARSRWSKVFDDYKGSYFVYWIVRNKVLYRIVGTEGVLKVYPYNMVSGHIAGGMMTVSHQQFFINKKHKCAISGSYMGCIGSPGTELMVIPWIDDESVKVFNTTIIDDGNAAIRRLESDNIAAFLITGTNKSLIVIYRGHRINAYSKIPSTATDYYVLPIGNNTLLVTLTRTHKKSISISGTILETAEPYNALNGNYQMENSIGDATIKSVTCLNLLQLKNVKCEILIASSDHVLSLLRIPHGVSWSREESLANIANVEMSELPISDIEVAIQTEFDTDESNGTYIVPNIWSMFARRIHSQYAQLLNMTMEFLKPRSNGTKTLVRDQFNLHKVIVAVTKVGKIIAIDNTNNNILWTHLVEDVDLYSSSTNPSEKIAPIYVQRGSSCFPHPPQYTVLFKHKDTENGVLFSFDPVTGIPAGNIRYLKYKAIQGILLTTEDPESRLHPLILIDSKYKFHVYPTTVSRTVAKHSSSIYFFVANHTTGDLDGYGFSQIDKWNLSLNKVWSVKCNGQIVAMKGKNALETVHSRGRVLSDRSVLYKYLNPNLVAFVCKSNDEKDNRSSLALYLVDAVTGGVMRSEVRSKAGGPVHLIHSEHWLAFFYSGDKSRRSEVSTYEFYEGTVKRNSSKFSSIESQHIDPITENQVYIIPISLVNAVKETVTEKLITSRHILIGLSTGYVVEMPWMILDPKRTLTMTQEAREEGILQYVPEIAMPPNSFINYNQTLHRIRGIHTTISSLESTCLVFVYGLDIFYTRVAPSKTFDLLSDDFDYSLLLMVLISFTIAAYVTKYFAHWKSLKLAWR